MINTSQLKSQIIQFLGAREKPLLFEEIYDFVLPLMDIDPELVQNSYSPAKTYHVGQRVFHPAEGIQDWFTVENIEDLNTMWVCFDNGQRKRLTQGNPNIHIPADPVGILTQTLQEMPEIKKLRHYYVSANLLNQFPLERVSDQEALVKYLYLMNSGEHMAQERRRNLQQLCREIGIECLYYIVRVENLLSILRKGILARNLAPIDRVSFANEDIQAFRHTIIPNPHIQFSLHDYAPLFFSAHPPLLYRFLEIPTRVVKILIDPGVLLRPGAVFYNMNARSTGRNTCFTDFAGLRELNWEMIRCKTWAQGTEEQKRLNGLYRQAEADIPLRVRTRYFQCVETANPKTRTTICDMVTNAGIDIPVVYQPDFF